MINSRVFVVVLLVSSMALLGGCKRVFGLGNCNKPQAYARAEELPPLKIPVGLDGLDTRAALRIPELTEPEAPRAADAPCLEEPPSVTVGATPAR
jgi:uncharacterized lipoprotein